MRFAPHWVRVSLGDDGQPDPIGPFVAFGWSLSDPDEARAMATERALRVRAWVHDYESDDAPEEDYYPTDGSVLREVALEHGRHGDVSWAVTRNRYGAEVLNVDGLGMLDVDIPVRRIVDEPKGFFGRLLGRRTVRYVSDDADDVLARVRPALQATGLGGRVYRTAAGFRVLITSTELSWSDPRFVELLDMTGTDRLYAALCRRQECCRARLTPKPWRIGYHSPPDNIVPAPWAPEPKPAWTRWLRTYQERSAGWSTTHLVETFGTEHVATSLVEVLARHDRCMGEHALA